MVPLIIPSWRVMADQGLQKPKGCDVWAGRDGRTRPPRSQEASLAARTRYAQDMRLWSLHPGHLDGRGLVTLWREGLLARAVLLGKTLGYRHHPQLARFKNASDPIRAIDRYLSRVLDEALTRGYRFDARKIAYLPPAGRRMPVTRGQLAFEWHHLLRKLATRDRDRWRAQRGLSPKVHVSFRVVPGPLASWERGAVKGD
jgi:hypothetical protein